MSATTSGVSVLWFCLQAFVARAHRTLVALVDFRALGREVGRGEQAVEVQLEVLHARRPLTLDDAAIALSRL
jgi:hypothetical protein